MRCGAARHELRARCPDANIVINKFVTRQVTDALLNYETVKYFTNEEMEANNYRGAIEGYQRSETVLLVSLNALNFVQGMIMFGGVAAGMTVCAAKARVAPSMAPLPCSSCCSPNVMYLMLRLRACAAATICDLRSSAYLNLLLALPVHPPAPAGPGRAVRIKGLNTSEQAETPQRACR
jgi:hypothetical protein